MFLPLHLEERYKRGKKVNWPKGGGKLGQEGWHLMSGWDKLVTSHLSVYLFLLFGIRWADVAPLSPGKAEVATGEPLLATSLGGNQWGGYIRKLTSEWPEAQTRHRLGEVRVAEPGKGEQAQCWASPALLSKTGQEEHMQRGREEPAPHLCLDICSDTLRQAPSLAL